MDTCPMLNVTYEHIPRSATDRILVRAKLASNGDWPRDGAVLRGTVVTAKGSNWLLATEVKQAGGDWIPAPAGAAMPFKHAQYYLE
jgi:hypothetical protein